MVYLVQKSKRIDEMTMLRPFLGRAKTLFWVEVIAIVTTYSMLLIQLYPQPRADDQHKQNHQMEWLEGNYPPSDDIRTLFDGHSF